MTKTIECHSVPQRSELSEDDQQLLVLIRTIIDAAFTDEKINDLAFCLFKKGAWDTFGSGMARTEKIRIIIEQPLGETSTRMFVIFLPLSGSITMLN